MQLIDCFSPLISFALYSREQMATDDQDSAEKIYDRFITFVEQARQCCDANGYTPDDRENALFAVVAWIDEYRLCAAEQSGGQWLHFELQRSLFNTSSAGDEFYDRLAAVDAENTALRDVFIHCLALGFRGRLYADPESFAGFCEQTLNIDAESPGGELPEVLFAEGYPGEATGKKGPRPRLPVSPFSLLVVLVSLGALGGLYLFCRQSLVQLYSSLPTLGL